jgi:LDH2 family malate/lactate/ureidoglycolate dehydrogenase
MARISHQRLQTHVAALFEAAGMDTDKAATSAEVLVEADMIGHATHGVGLLPWYLDSLTNGELQGSGTYRVVQDREACVTWDGNNLAGPWLVTEAFALACERVGRFGVVTVAIARAHHIGALAAYLRKVTDRGYIAELSCSTASQARVAPFGGTKAQFTPNPIAFGFPTDADPILIDISSSITTTTMTRELAATGKRFPDAWALTADGTPTDDPAAVTERGGTLMPLGGALKGNKGYGLALAIETMGQGLSGFGRSGQPKGMQLSVFLRVTDPSAFAGNDAYLREATHLANACRANPPPQGMPPVRVPGDSAARHRRESLAEGVAVDDAVLQKIGIHARRLGVASLS